MAAASFLVRPLRTIRCACNALAWLSLLAFSSALAGEPDAAGVRHSLNIPRQTLDAALKDLAQQTDLQIVRFSDAVKGDAIVGPLKGTYSIEQALQALLAPGGLTYRSLNPRAYMVITPQELGIGAVAPASSEDASHPEDTVPRRSPGSAASHTRSTHETRGAVSETAAYTGRSLEQIIVTAQKTAEPLREIPMSVTAMTARDLQSLAATQFVDFANAVPGLTFTSSGVGQTQVNLRGITSGYNVSPTVGIYIDEVPYGSSTPFVNGAQLALDVGLFDMSRVEILRGPQGTLYGASTMGGLLKYVTNAPDMTSFGGTAKASVLSTEHGGVSYDASSALNVPLVQDKAALRIGGFYRHNGGYIDNLLLADRNVDRTDLYGGRADLLYAPSERLAVRLTAYAQDVERDGTIAADFNRVSGLPLDDSLDQRHPLAEPFAQRFRLASATVDYAFDFAALTSISSYQTAHSEATTDFSALYVPQFGGPDVLSAVALQRNTATDKWTQELRLAARGQSMDWMLGAFFTGEDSEQFQQLRGYDPDGALSPVNLFTATFPSRFEEHAGFGNLTLHVTDKLDIAGGVRFAHSAQRQQQIASGQVLDTLPARSSSDSVTTYLVSIRYRPSKNVMPYLRFATGYRPGGPNLTLNDASGQPVAPATFDSDRLASYEAGVKFASAEQRFDADLALYYIDWDDMQIVAIRNGLGVIVNAATARSLGAELIVGARPVPALTLSGAVGYTNAELTADAPDLGGREGESLPDTPRLTASLSADYLFDMAEHAAFAGATVRHVDDRNASFDGSVGMPQYELPGYTVVDLRAGIAFSAARVHLYCKNVGDTRGQFSAMTGTSPLGGPANVSILQPRAWGLSVEMSF